MAQSKDPSDPAPRIHWLNLRYTERQCPGMHEILSMAPADQRSALVRGILYQWCQHHMEHGTLTQAIIATLAGPGVSGQRALRRTSRARQLHPPMAVPGAGPATPVKQPEPMQPYAGAGPALTAARQLPVAAAQELKPLAHPPPGKTESPMPDSTAAGALFDMFD